MTERRDKRGRFIKGNVPWNKRLDSKEALMSPEAREVLDRMVGRRRGITFTCKFCGEQKPIEEMKVAMRFFPPLPVCRDCWKLL